MQKGRAARAPSPIGAGDHFPFLDMPRTVPIVERRGCDLNPIDPTLDQSRMTMLSIIWADQTDRLQQLAEVIEIAGRVPAPVDRCNAVERPGVATVDRDAVPCRGASREVPMR